VKTIDRRWVLIDAKGQILGRLASRIAILLRGKHKATFTPFLDTGDFVVVINARNIQVTGSKLTQKRYRTYSGYPSGLRETTLGDMLEKHPERVIHLAVKGMLPDGPLGRKLLGKLKVYPDATHPHQAQRSELVASTSAN
ncbi:MAG: 50S ribosomal protein L13, partial [Candidatus Omnitrophica bacterium]|nr:50S ribosomal protein L13 [Candidatus Omnitrophota bacterium]